MPPVEGNISEAQSSGSSEICSDIIPIKKENVKKKAGNSRYCRVQPNHIMNTGFLHHSLGLADLECASTKYEDKSIILNVQTSACKLRCTCCGSKPIVRNGFVIRPIRCVLIDNKPLAQAYYLTESLKEIGQQMTKKQAEIVPEDWVKQAKDSKLPGLIKMTNTLAAHRSGILAWYDCKISTGKVEGINHKIKVMKRKAYGF